MRAYQIPQLPTDLLDRLVLDICELENLAERLIQSLHSANLASVPRGSMAVQLLDLLSRVEGASGALQQEAGDHVKTVASALSSDSVVDPKLDGPHRDHGLVGTVDGGELAMRLRRP